jgi:tetratricopeptide (TPR) repeat protein
LSDPEVRALEKGPLAALVQGSGVHRQAEAEQVLQQLAELVATCLERGAEARPRAEEVQQRLGALAEQVGLKRWQVGTRPETPTYEAIYYGHLAMTLGKLGHEEARLQMALRARDLEPEDPNRWLQVGAALASLGRLEEALEVYEGAKRLVPEERRARSTLLLAKLANNRGNNLSKLKRYAEAVAALEQSVRIRPGYLPAWHILGLAYWKWAWSEKMATAKRVALMEQALAAVERALAIEPNARNSQ